MESKTLKSGDIQMRLYEQRSTMLRSYHIEVDGYSFGIVHNLPATPTCPGGWAGVVVGRKFERDGRQTADDIRSIIANILNNLGRK